MKKVTIYVIYAGPVQWGCPGTKYFDENGNKTDLETKAVKFYSHGDACVFANNHGINLNAINYIGGL